MHKGNLSRRGFMQRSLAGLTAAGLPLWYAQEVFAAEQEGAKQEAKKVAANDKIVVGLIGCGGQGRGILRGARGDKRVEVAAVCDVDRGHREAAAKESGKDVATFEDFRRLNDRKDINAVLIGTPDHWHALIAIDAMRKGKDVYCEKPLTLTIAESQAVAKVAAIPRKSFRSAANSAPMPGSVSLASWSATVESARSRRWRRASATTRWAARSSRKKSLPG